MLATVESQNEELLKLVRENRMRLLKVKLLVRRLRRREQAIAKASFASRLRATGADRLTA
jgi:hypothetical protein